MPVELQSLALSFENHDLSQRCESLHLENENLRTQIQQLRKGSATPKKNAQERGPNWFIQTGCILSCVSTLCLNLLQTP